MARLRNAAAPSGVGLARLSAIGRGVSLLADPVRRDRSPGIDCLRGALALYVVCTHVLPWAQYLGTTTTPVTQLNAWLIRIFQGHAETNPAVLGFIVLSGYCIHRNGLRAESRNVRAYAIRRAFRIVPVYLLGCAVGVALLAGAGPTAHVLTGTPTLSLSGLLAKLTAIGAVVPSAYAPSFQGNAPLVTVAAEMWLYALYVVLIGRWRMLWPVVAVIWLAAFLFVVDDPTYLGWWSIGSVVGFLPYWWLGALFVNPSFVGRRRSVLIAAGVLWLALSIALDRHTGSMLVVEARKLMLAVLIGGMIVRLDGAHHDVLAAGSKIGRAGYSIYALHAPIIVALLVAGVAWPLCALAAVLTALVSFAAYERPLLRAGARIAARSTPAHDSRVEISGRGEAQRP
jgi:peptidoglycan/LPS O-acetylase OafA/YrhL